MLTFVVPVLHHENVSDWSSVKERMEITLRSIASQLNPHWNCVIVANNGADLPKIHNNIDVVLVDFPRNILPKGGPNELRYQAIRKDKGARILAGLLHARPTGHVMVVDYDDLVSRRLAGLVDDNQNSNGWYFDDGYLYSGGDQVFYYEHNFFRYCGTSHIIRSDLLKIPSSLEEAKDDWISRWLGSHIYICDDLHKNGTGLLKLPFPGTIYRIGYRGATSGSPDLSGFIASRKLEGSVKERNLLRHVDDILAADFFGGDVA